MAAKKKTMTEDEVLALMRDEQGTSSMREFAAEIGVTAAYISDIYNCRRRPGKAILRYLKLGKTRVFNTEYFKL